MIEQAEAALHELGFRVCRVRHHDSARRGSSSARDRNGAWRSSLAMREQDRRSELRAIGYQHVTVDLQGYRMGSLNDGVQLRPV